MWSSIERFSPIEAAQKREREKRLDELFNVLIATRVLNDYMDDLACSDLPDEVQEEFEKSFDRLSDEDKRAVLAIPAQLRPIQFRKYAEKGVGAEEMIADMLTKARKYGFTLGFHLSKYDIPQAQDGSWHIRGTEPDHRHSDLPMAYYSMDWRDRYKDKHTNFLYVIRAETGESTSHYRDTDGRWGHAASLSIISKVDLHEVERELAARFKEAENDEKGGDAAGAPPVHTSAI